MADLTRVPLLIEQLGDEQEEIRDRARRELLDLGPAVVPFLIQVIREDNRYSDQHEAAWSTRAAGERRGVRWAFWTIGTMTCGNARQKHWRSWGESRRPRIKCWV
jgi:hypothetical protein